VIESVESCSWELRTGTVQYDSIIIELNTRWNCVFSFNCGTDCRCGNSNKLNCQEENCHCSMISGNYVISWWLSESFSLRTKFLRTLQTLTLLSSLELCSSCRNLLLLQVCNSIHSPQLKTFIVFQLEEHVITLVDVAGLDFQNHSSYNFFK
jgi:hypothetical protein